jgi:hypothetical protein
MYYYPIPQNVRTPGDCPPPWLHPDQTTTGGIAAVVCIGATDANDNIANFSSRGPVSWQSISGYNDYPYNPDMGLIRPDVCAPGVNIKSCLWNNNSGYQFMDGTSMATPGVAGVMALMLSKNPQITPAEICEILETTALHLPNASSPKGNIFGSGRIDAFEAVSAVNEPITCDTVTDLVALVNENEVTLSWVAPELIAEVLHYNIFRDDEFVCSVDTESFIENVCSGRYVYAVEAAYINDCISDKVSVDLLVLKTPINLIATPLSKKIELTWEYDNDEILFNVFRDDTLFVSNISGMQYTDTVVDIDIQYCYYIKATVEEIESAASNIDCALIVGIEEVATGIAKVYPNPAHSIINIEGKLMESITIFNSVGQMVKALQANGDIIQINISNFVIGNYIFRISYLDGSTENIKVVITKN